MTLARACTTDYWRSKARHGILPHSIDKMQNALKNRFPPFLDEHSLRSAIESICSPYGNITRLKIGRPVRHFESDAIQCECFLSLDSKTAEAMLKISYNVSDFPEGLQFFAEVAVGYDGLSA
jgi:hypothetical protein